MLFLFCTLLLFAICAANAVATGKSPADLHDSITLNVNKGNSTLILCDLRYNGTMDIIWNKNGAPLSSNSHYNISQSFLKSQDNYNVSWRSTLKISSATANDTGTYTCKFNTTNDDFKTFTLTVIDSSNSRDLWLSYLFILTVICICILGVYVLKYACKL